MWNWIENVNEKEPERAVTLEGDNDENQDSLMSINYGLNDYGRLEFMLQMADLLKEKRRLAAADDKSEKG